jgi:glycosyltransferase involved in cell wall biosynthesis
MGAAALRAACYQRFARKVAGEYDVRISAYNLTDWGLPAVHFIADFSWHQRVREQLDPMTPGLIYRNSWLRKMYLGTAARYQDLSGREILREDKIVANSHWTAELMRQVCEVECAAIAYPPVCGEFPKVTWQNKQNAFVMIGRVAPEKRVEEAIAILEAVRQRGHAIQLHLCGNIGRDSYGRKIAALCQKHADWITSEGFVTGERKMEMLTRCRYGIQTRSAEPFGISVAEMIKAGAIVFAPHDGGQAEILEHPDLLFSDKSDAAERISAVLESAELQDKLRMHLSAQAQRFSAEQFVRDVRQCVRTSTEVYV